MNTEKMEFDGDIIITDPCYVVKDDEWEKSNYGYNMERLGISRFMTRDTIYGDLSCTVYNSDTEEKLGNFCADAGLVSVMLLDDVLEYNPDYDYHTQRPWTTTLIRDFKGIVEFVVKEVKYTYQGIARTDYEVQVVGHGINKANGTPINFIGYQTGL